MHTPNQAPWMAPLMMFAVFAMFAILTSVKANRATMGYITSRLRGQAVIAGVAAIGSLNAAILLGRHSGELRELSLWGFAGFIMATITLAVALVDCMTHFERQYWIRLIASAGLTCAGISTVLAMAALTDPTYESLDPAAVNISIRDAWIAVNIATYASFALIIAALAGLLIKTGFNIRARVKAQRLADMAKM